MVPTDSLLDVWHLGQIVENKPASSLVVSLGKALNRKSHLYVEEGGPDTSEMGTSKQVQISHPKYSDTICFLMNEG